MAHAVRGIFSAGLLLGAGALPVAAQSLALPAADPVGISRSGVQVAYGYSLEAAATNPALLTSLREKSGAYLSVGLEMAGTQQSLESSQHSFFTSDRNRTVGAFGLALRRSPTLTLGLKMDEPFLRHGRLPGDAPTRYLGDSLDLSARRLEAQAAWALNPSLSVGVGLGVARLSYGSSSVVRLGVPNATTGLVDGLVEQRIGESGNKVVPSYSLGVRWAISPRWTLGFVHQSGLKGDLDLKAHFQDAPLGYYANDGLSLAPLGTVTRAAAMLATATAAAGNGTLDLPSRTTVGMRHRTHPMVTWEADLSWTSGGLQMPGFATAHTTLGTATSPSPLPRGKGHLGAGASTEIELGKFWTLRAGLFLDQRSIEATRTEPLLGGSRTAGFSVGAGYKVFGGELNLGYQFRQSEDQDSRQLDGVWSSAGFRNVGTRLRVEGMGHLVALGFKKTF